MIPSGESEVSQRGKKSLFYICDIVQLIIAQNNKLCLLR